MKDYKASQKKKNIIKRLFHHCKIETSNPVMTYLVWINMLEWRQYARENEKSFAKPDLSLPKMHKDKQIGGVCLNHTFYFFSCYYVYIRNLYTFQI